MYVNSVIKSSITIQRIRISSNWKPHVDGLVILLSNFADQDFIKCKGFSEFV